MKLSSTTVGPFTVPAQFADKIKHFAIGERRRVLDVFVDAMESYFHANQDESDRIDALLDAYYGSSMPLLPRSVRDVKLDADLQLACEDVHDPGYRASHGLVVESSLLDMPKEKGEAESDAPDGA